MSSVTDVFVIIGDSEDGQAGTVAPRVAEALTRFLYGQPIDIPIISLKRDDWSDLQSGSKVAGSAAIWFGWNYARPEELEAHLQEQGFKRITVWSHHEFDECAPRVVSW